MARRLVLAAVVVAAVLVLAAPAMAFNGYRATYTTSDYCRPCHAEGSPIPSAPIVYDDWAATTHASDAANAEQISDGPGCAGCHSSNYDPAKHIPIDPTASPLVYPDTLNGTQGSGTSAFSEGHIGCSACHWGARTGSADLYGSEPNDTAHRVPIGNMANADICGQCHTRYSKSTTAYTNYDGTSAQREYTIGTFNPVGVPTPTPTPTAWPVEPITDYLNVPTPASPQSMAYYTAADGVTKLLYNGRAHEEGAGQYEEWAQEGHAGALTTLTSQAFWGFFDEATKQECLECHSTDFRILSEAGKNPTSSQVQYGVTCQACHDPHAKGEQTSVWNEERNPQLTAPRQQLCVECHNGELADQPDGSPGVAAPGSEVHHPMNEMMNGTGAIDVPQGSPSVHKGKCVQCHMPPTGYLRAEDGIDHPAGTAGNHVFAIITPETAETSTVTLTSPAQTKNMPNSACSTCHSRPGDDNAVWLQDTLTDRQAAMHDWDDQVTTALALAATFLGYDGADDAAKIAAANAGINDKDRATWSARELAFQKAFTNQQYIESEGSWGIHNWEYARTVILKALEEAKSVQAEPWTVGFRASRYNVKRGGTDRFSGVVTGAGSGTVAIQRKTGGVWRTWKTATIQASGAFSRSVRMTVRGTYTLRAFVAGNAAHLDGKSRQIKVVVR